MAVNNNFQYQELTGSAYYVSAFYGDDLNAGTSASPFATISKAETVAISGDTIIIGSGYYIEESANTTPFRYLGEGKVVWQQPGGATNNALADDTVYVENITFLNWNSTAVIKHGTGNPVPNFTKCTFVDCTINAGNESSYGSYIACVFDTVFFDSNGTVETNPSALAIINCIFRECTGTLLDLQDYIHGVFNNHFVECDTLVLGIAPGQPVSKFDHNNIEGGLNNYVDNAAIQADGFNLNGTSELSTDVFQDFDILRSTSDYFLQDYGQKTSSALLNSSKSTGPSCSLNKTFRFTASDFITNVQDQEDIILVGNQLQLDGPVMDGFITSLFDLGQIVSINLVQIIQEIQWNVRAEIVADDLLDVAPKATYDVLIEHRQNLVDPFVPAQIEYDKYIVDRAPQTISARYLLITLRIRNYTI